MILTLILTSGCRILRVFRKNKSNKVNVTEQGTMYKRVMLYDTQNNVGVFEGVIPADWKTNIESKWNVVSSIIPGLETVTISNPNSTASIIITSQEGYVENAKYNEGENHDYYTTYLHYMDASTFLDYSLNKRYPNITKTKDLEVDEDILNQLKEYTKLKYEEGKISAEQLNGVTPSVSVSVSEHAVTMSKKQYDYGLNKIEASTGVSSIKTNLNSSLSPLLSSESISWTIPYTIIYQAETQEDFDEYYNDYEFIVANSHFTTDYYAMVEYVSSVIVNYYTTIYAERAKASLDATNKYIESNYSSTSSESTNDKVMRMWDDYINEVDEYKLEDGSTLRIDMHNETVAQNGDEIYIGSKAGIPIGFNEVSKSYG